VNARATHGTPEGDATIAIQQLARTTGADVQELQTLYVLEALLSRIATSPHAEDFVLKGGVLLAAFAARRPTRDIDLAATRMSNDTEDVAARIRDIATINLADGVVLNPTSIKAAAIRDADQYAGVRVKLVGTLGTARLSVGIDINFGDPIWPAPQRIEFPRVVAVGLPPLVLLGYPLPMVLAEKIVTAIDRGAGNTRWRDFADIYTLVLTHPIDADELRGGLEAVAAYRQVELRPLLPALASMPAAAQSKWHPWRTRVGRSDELPEAFSDVLDAVARFADPALDQTATGTWRPTCFPTKVRHRDATTDQAQRSPQLA
jgi:hypothetical protein